MNLVRMQDSITILKTLPRLLRVLLEQGEKREDITGNSSMKIPF